MPVRASSRPCGPGCAGCPVVDPNLAELLRLVDDLRRAGEAAGAPMPFSNTAGPAEAWHVDLVTNALRVRRKHIPPALVALLDAPGADRILWALSAAELSKVAAALHGSAALFPSGHGGQTVAPEAVDVDSAPEAGGVEPEAPDVLAEALRWARAGYAVFPCHEVIRGPNGSRCSCGQCTDPRKMGKHPRTVRGLLDATTDESQIRAWWKMWPNAPIGAPTGGGWFVVDLDGPEAEAWLRDRVAEHGELPRTREITTGRPEGGRHLWFLGDGVRNSTSKVSPKVDTRGDGGYVILPPSLHESGRRYRMSVDEPVAEAPAWLLEVARGATGKPKGKPTPNQGAPRSGGPAGSDIRKRLDGLVRLIEDRIAETPEGQRNDTLNREAFSFGQYLGHYGIDLGEYGQRLVNAGIRCGLSDREAESTVVRALAEGADDPKPLPERGHPDEGSAGFAGFADGGGTNNAWPTPVPFRVARSGPDFPVDALVEPFASYAAALSREKGTPVDLACMLILAMVAGALQGKVFVHRPGHDEPVSLWTCGLMSPSERKSAIYGALKVPIDELQGETDRTELPRWKEAKEEVDALDEAIGKERKRVLGKGAPRDRLEDLRAQRAATPVLHPPQRFAVDDVTPEKLAVHMSENGGRAFMGSAEGDTLFRIALGHYTDGQSNLDVYLKGYSGEHLRVDRLSRPAVTVRRAALSLALATQPAALQDRVSSESRGRGFLARFLFYRPTSMVGFRTERTEPVDPGLTQQYRASMTALWKTNAGRDDLGEWVQAPVNLTAEAEAAWWSYNVEIETAQRPGGALADLHDFAGKHAGKVLRVACVLHAMEHPTEDPASRAIGAEAMANAIRIGRYALDHLLALEMLDPVAPEVALAERILAWLRNGGRRSFTKRELFDGHRAWFGENADRVDAPLRALEVHGYIRRSASDGTKRRGFDVNPIVFADSP